MTYIPKRNKNDYSYYIPIVYNNYKEAQNHHKISEEANNNWQIVIRNKKEKKGNV
jgi:hypothetical protein